MSEFTHLDEHGNVRMVDVGAKPETVRVARAQAVVHMKPETLALILEGKAKKGNVLETARIAGIMAAKKTSGLIPMCHPLPITHASVDFFPETADSSIRIEAEVRTTARTGVEMEAMCAASVAGLTLYDMCKSYDREMHMTGVLLLEKSGGKSGHFVRRT